ncbi:hypothetical protein Tco_0632908 [Tanacetum coccineum]
MSFPGMDDCLALGRFLALDINLMPFDPCRKTVILRNSLRLLYDSMNLDPFVSPNRIGIADESRRKSRNFQFAHRLCSRRLVMADPESIPQEGLSFSDLNAIGKSHTFIDDPSFATSFLNSHSRRGIVIFLEEVDAFLALEDDPTSPEVDHSYYDPEGDILLLEAFLNDDPSLPPPT